MQPVSRPSSHQVTRTFVRIVFIVVVTGYAVLTNGMDIALPWHPFATFGFTANAQARVTSVDAASARGGLHAGDRIDVSRLSPVERVNLLSFFTTAPEGRAVALPIFSAGGDHYVRLVSHIRPRSLADNVTDVISVLALALYAIIAGALVLLRPLPATWAFFGFSLSFFDSPTLFTEYASRTFLVFQDAVLGVAGVATSVFFLWFALRFPNNILSGAAKKLERVLLFVWGPAMAIVALAGIGALAAGNVTGHLFWVQSFGTTPLFFAGIAVLIGRYARADAHNRNRLRWIVSAFAVAFLPIMTVNYVESSPLFSILPPVWIINLCGAWTLLAPLALAYTILKHRLFDIRFVFSRALIYGITTAVFVGIIALVDWGAGKWLAESKFAILTELALALIVGISLNALHRRIETFLNGVIFRAQAKMLEAIRKFAHEVDLITDPERLLMQTFEALRTRLENDYVCIYAIDGTSYALVRCSGSSPAILSADDFAVLHLRRWHEPFVCEEVAHPLRGSLLLPMSVRNELIGFIACGPKTDRTHYLPEEVQTLSELTHRVGTAYGWLTIRPNPLQIAAALP